MYTCHRRAMSGKDEVQRKGSLHPGGPNGFHIYLEDVAGRTRPKKAVDYKRAHALALTLWKEAKAPAHDNCQALDTKSFLSNPRW